MKRLQPYPVAVALSFIFSILYLVCVGLHLLIPGALQTSWPMHRLWEMVLPGFTWFTSLDFFIGALDIFAGGFYVGYILVPLYNYFDGKSADQEGDESVKPLRFKPVVLSLASFGAITYILCVLFDLIFPQWAMYQLWEILLPGFTWLNWGSFFIGLLEIIAYAVYVSVLLVPIYNFFRKGQLPRVG